MKQLLTTIAAVVLMGCGESQSPDTPKAKKPDIGFHMAAVDGNIEAVKQHLDAGVNVNAKDAGGYTALHRAVNFGRKKTVKMLIDKGADVNARNENKRTPLFYACLNLPRFDLMDLSESKTDELRDIESAEMAEILIAKGANLNLQDMDGSTSLDWAIKEGLTKTVATLQKSEARTSKWLESGKSIYTASEAGNIEALNKHLSSGIDVNLKDYFGGTPLHHAAEYGQIKAAASLISQGADVNAKTEGGETALHLAANKGQVDVAELLIAKGVDVNAKDKYGKTPLDEAESFQLAPDLSQINKNAITALLRKHGGKTGEELKVAESRKAPAQPPSPPVEPVAKAAPTEPPTAKAPATSIHDAAMDGDIEAVKQHLADGADVNAKTEDGKTPLDNADGEIADLLHKHGGKSGVELSIHGAVRVGNIEAVKKYIAMGENLDSKDAEGQTPLCRAVQYGEKDVIKLLIQEGADVNARMNFGDTALDYANASGGLWMSYEVQKEVVELLHKHGGKTGEELKTAGKTTERVSEAATPDRPLWKAARDGNIEAVKQHLADGSDVNAKNMEGGTPLHIATILGHTELAELLIAESADVNAKTEEGETPLHFAAWLSQKGIAELLIANGADVNAKHDDGITALDLAIKYKRPKFADLLRKHGGKTGAELKAEGK